MNDKVVFNITEISQNSFDGGLVNTIKIRYKFEKFR